MVKNAAGSGHIFSQTQECPHYCARYFPEVTHFNKEISLLVLKFNFWNTTNQLWNSQSHLFILFI